ncbi:MAG TPA: YggS family pyridoxal phosphate-dependent enzyme [Candidatus Limnocylindrales bacterium]|nr:YggS family pyridoxal phosphate-dependent enzyme [Candidatus Limnocylindrales bacterium]
MTDPARLAATRAEILGEIADAAARSGRNAAAVRVVAVSKTVEPARITAAAAAGWDTFGENRVQERTAKAGELADLRAEWHLIGPLQSNKARKAVELFDVIESVGSTELARRLDRVAGEVRPGRPMPVLLQVNVDDDPAKAGFGRDDLARELPAILFLPNLRVDGLMTVGRLVDQAEDARPTFVALRELAGDLRGREAHLGTDLSMGMSGDYAIAVEEGATIVRIGRAIFGDRPHHG